MACNLEPCLVRFFDGYREQFLVEWNIWRALGAGSLVPACECDLDQVSSSINLCPNRVS
jgi:hypothetical protein